MHALLTRNLQDINAINKCLETVNFEGKIASILNRIKTELDTKSALYNYLVAGPSSWNKFVNDNMQYFTGQYALSEYEMSALKN